MTYRNGLLRMYRQAQTLRSSPPTESAPAQSFGATTFGDDIGPPSAAIA